MHESVAFNSGEASPSSACIGLGSYVDGARVRLLLRESQTVGQSI